MSGVLIAVTNLAVQQGRRQPFRGVSFTVRAGQVLGVSGVNGAGKTALLRALIGAVAPCEGDIRLNGLRPRDALSRTPTAYFAGESTLPGHVRAARWGDTDGGTALLPERRRIRTLPRGLRQLLGLRAELGRHPLAIVLLDEPWEGLDPDAVRWLNATIETKRDRGAAVVVSSRRPQDLAAICDRFLLLTPYAPLVLDAHDLEPTGQVGPERLAWLFDELRTDPTSALSLLPRGGYRAAAAPRKV